MRIENENGGRTNVTSLPFSFLHPPNIYISSHLISSPLIHYSPRPHKITFEPKKPPPPKKKKIFHVIGAKIGIKTWPLNSLFIIIITNSYHSPPKKPQARKTFSRSWSPVKTHSHRLNFTPPRPRPSCHDMTTSLKPQPYGYPTPRFTLKFERTQ